MGKEISKREALGTHDGGRLVVQVQKMGEERQPLKVVVMTILRWLRLLCFLVDLGSVVVWAFDWSEMRITLLCAKETRSSSLKAPHKVSFTVRQY